MKIRKLLLGVLFAAAVASQGEMAVLPPPGPEPAWGIPRIGHVTNQERAPAVSVPQEYMAPNGDRLSPYPPYYHSEHGGRGHR